MTTEPSSTEYNKLPQLLRGLGSAVLIAAAVSFATQGWDGWNSLERYYCFLTFLLITVATGVFCSQRLKEAKGARTLFGVACAIVPALFAQLGAMIFASVKGTPNINPFFVLSGGSIWELTTALLITAPIAGAATFFGFSALNRGRARELTATYLLTNCALLIPTRDSDLIAALVLALTALTVGLLVSATLKGRINGQREGAVSQLIVFLPILTVVTRTALYTMSDLFVSVLCLLLGLLFFLIEVMGVSPFKTKIFHFSARSSFLLASYNFALCFVNEFSTHVLLAVSVYFAVLNLLATLLEEDQARYRSSAAEVVGCGMMVSLFLSGGDPVLALSTLLLSIVLLSQGVMVRQRWILFSGLLGFVVSLATLTIPYVKHLFGYSPWITLSALGLTLVLSASYLEKELRRLVQKLGQTKEELALWNR